MKSIISLLLVLFFSAFALGQNEKEIKIESGSTFLKYQNGKLDSIIVSMFAENYGNALLCSKTQDAIIIKNAADSLSVIKIELKNNKQVRTFLYKNQAIITLEAIDFDVNHLPKNALISSSVYDDTVSSFKLKSNFESLGNDNPDKTFKLFNRLYINPNLDTLDGIFDNIATFFSQEDALLKIFYGRYAEKFEPKALAYINTNTLGKITNGIVWKSDQTSTFKSGKYDIYIKGKITKSGNETLDSFQKTYYDFREKLEAMR